MRYPLNINTFILMAICCFFLSSCANTDQSTDSAKPRHHANMSGKDINRVKTNLKKLNHSMSVDEVNELLGVNDSLHKMTSISDMFPNGGEIIAVYEYTHFLDDNYDLTISANHYGHGKTVVKMVSLSGNDLGYYSVTRW